MTEEKTNRRCRMAVSITAKGLAQWDVTSEYDTPEEAERNLVEGINRIRGAIMRSGLTEAAMEGVK